MSPKGHGLAHEACIGLGSNLGDSLSILRKAWRQLTAHPAIFSQALSSPYLTSPVEMDSTHQFVNAAGVIRTSLDPHALLCLLHVIEAQHGRVRSKDAPGYADRTLDLDLLLYDQVMVHSSTLVLPHPRMAARLFVLLPLAQIAGARIYPTTGQTVDGLLANLLAYGQDQDVRQVEWSM